MAAGAPEAIASHTNLECETKGENKNYTTYTLMINKRDLKERVCVRVERDRNLKLMLIQALIVLLFTTGYLLFYVL